MRPKRFFLGPPLTCSKQVVERRVELVHALHISQPRVQLGKDEESPLHLLHVRSPGRAVTAGKTSQVRHKARLVR